MSKYGELADELVACWNSCCPSGMAIKVAAALRELEADNELLQTLAVGLAKLALRHGAEAMELIATLEWKEDD